MAFPLVAASSIGNDGGAASHSIAIMACAIGDTILVWATIDNNASGGPTTMAGFDRVLNHSEGNGVNYCFLARRVVNGTESWYNGGAGGNATMVHNAGQVCAWTVMRITGADPAAYSVLVFPSGSATTIASSAAPNPPLLTPLWSTSDTLWLAAYAEQDGSISATAYPAGYSLVAKQGFGTSFIGCNQAVAQKSARQASDDPSAFTTSGPGGSGWSAATFAVRGLDGGGFVGEPGGGLW